MASRLAGCQARLSASHDLLTESLHGPIEHCLFALPINKRMLCFYFTARRGLDSP